MIFLTIHPAVECQTKHIVQMPISVRPLNSSLDTFSHLFFSREVMASQNDCGTSWNIFISAEFIDSIVPLFQKAQIHYPVPVAVFLAVRYIEVLQAVVKQS